MSKRSSAPVLAAVVVVAVGGMALLNKSQYDNRPKTMQELQAEEAMKAPPDTHEADRKPAGVKTGAPSPGDKLIDLGPDAVVGEAKAPRTMTIGYRWSPEVQADPMRVYGPIEMVTKMSQGGVKIRVVNLDAPGAPAVPEGLSSEGKVYVRLRPEGGFDPQEMQKAVGEAMKAGVIPPTSAGSPGK
jgi:hypothetical protein